MPMPRRITRLVLLTGCALAFVLVVHLVPVSRPRLSPFGSSSPPPPLTPPLKFVPSSLDWTQMAEFYPPSSIKPLPAGRPEKLRRVQAPAEAFGPPSPQAEERRAAVRRAFERSWQAYRKHAWGHDELRPVSGGAQDPFGGWAASLVDSLDTLWIMGLRDEFTEASAAACALDWAATDADAANLFETTIRHLGGLLGAYDLSGEPALLAKARELGEMLYHAFDTPNRLPGFWLNFADARAGNQLAGTNDPSAAPASLGLELTRLSQLTGDARFYDAADRVTRFLERTQNETLLPGMWPVTLDFQNEQATDGRFTLGALADSLYEYLPKMHALLGGLDGRYEALYGPAMDAAAAHLLFRPMLPDGRDVLFAGDWHAKAAAPRVPEAQHLTCFAGAMFALGGRLFGRDGDVDVGDRLARGCAWAYARFPTGLMPEIADLAACPSLERCAWDADAWRRQRQPADARRLPEGFTAVRDARYLLRPEAIESLFVLYRVTARPDLQDLAWDMFRAIMRATETDLANSAIDDVTATGDTKKTDSMESFWMAETLKYFYLIFSPPDLISLDDWVLNTEAHPLRRPS